MTHARRRKLHSVCNCVKAQEQKDPGSLEILGGTMVPGESQ